MVLIVRAWSPRYGRDVEIGEGQDRFLTGLRERAGSAHTKWFVIPTLRSFGLSPATVWNYLDRLHALGVIGLQTKRGQKGFVRVTLRPRRDPAGRLRMGMLHRFTRAVFRRPAPGQTTLGLLEERVRAPEPARPAALASPEPAGSFSELMAAAGFRRFWQ